MKPSIITNQALINQSQPTADKYQPTCKDEL